MQISPEKSQSGDAPGFLPLRLRSLSLTSECLVFANLLIILASSLVMIALFRRLRLPPVLGYLCVGLMVGPTAFNWVNESEHLPDVAELGVVFLLFSLGLEFSLSKMIALRQVVFRLGSQQVLLSTDCSGWC
jgi:CPA2 family monovalent cation:H+ antiporter-2